MTGTTAPEGSEGGLSGVGDVVRVAILDAAGIDGDVRAEDHLALIRTSAEAEREVRGILRQAVESARAGGVSWAAIGAELGMTRQAAQQRFGDAGRSDAAEPDTTGEAVPSEYRWLGPVTAFDEMPELELAGRAGWRTVDGGMFRHRMVRTDTQWEHKRLIWRGLSRRDEEEGWMLAWRWFPWAYLVRDLGTPPPSHE